MALHLVPREKTPQSLKKLMRTMEELDLVQKNTKLYPIFGRNLEIRVKGADLHGESLTSLPVVFNVPASKFWSKDFGPEHT